MSKVENVQELLNGIKDFITDKIEQGEDASLTSFLEDVALATDFDSKKDDDKAKRFFNDHSPIQRIGIFVRLYVLV